MAFQIYKKLMEPTIVSVKWTQHKKLIFLILEAKNISIETINISLTPEGHLTFFGIDRITGVAYKLDILLFNEVVVDESKWKVTDYCVQFSISKRNKETQFWPRLTKQKEKLKYISVDWERWIDEDETVNKKTSFDPDELDDMPYENHEYLDSKDIDRRYLQDFPENLGDEVI